MMCLACLDGRVAAQCCFGRFPQWQHHCKGRTTGVCAQTFRLSLRLLNLLALELASLSTACDIARHRKPSSATRPTIGEAARQALNFLAGAVNWHRLARQRLYVLLWAGYVPSHHAACTYALQASREGRAMPQGRAHARCWNAPSCGVCRVMCKASLLVAHTAAGVMNTSLELRAQHWSSTCHNHTARSKAKPWPSSTSPAARRSA
jgi:hypothetical protein